MLTDISALTDLNNKFNAYLKDSNIEIGMFFFAYKCNSNLKLTKWMIPIVLPQVSICPSKCSKRVHGRWDLRRWYHLPFRKNSKNPFEWWAHKSSQFCDVICSPQYINFQFENFYHLNFSGRKLTWLHHLYHGELKLSYLKKPYIITMQTYQMAMLLLFESVDVMTCKDIQVMLDTVSRIPCFEYT